MAQKMDFGLDMEYVPLTLSTSSDILLQAHSLDPLHHII